MGRKKIISIVFLLPFCFSCWCSDTLIVNSPSGKISLKVWLDKGLKYCISYDRRIILSPSSIDFLVENKEPLSGNKSFRSSVVKEVNSEIISPVPEKRKIIPDNYRLLSVSFSLPYKVEFRVYNDGAAYRILTSFKDSIRVINEVAEFSFPGRPSAFFPAVHKRDDADIFHTSFEEEYPQIGRASCR